MKLLNIKKIILASALVAGGILSPTAFAQNIVSNGDFSSGRAGWAFSGIAPAITNLFASASPTPYAYAAPIFSSVGTASQNLTTLAGHQYTLSFVYGTAVSGGGSPPATTSINAQVKVGGAVLSTITSAPVVVQVIPGSPTVVSPVSNAFSRYSNTFTAGGVTTSLGFLNATGTMYITDISVIDIGGAPTPSGPTAEEIAAAEAAAAAAFAAAQAAALRTSSQQSIVNTAQALQGTYALQNSVLANSFTYDCTLFDKNNICVSGGARNTAVQAANGLNNTSALLIAAYRPVASVRIGAYADQNLSVNNGGSTVNLSNNTPLIGLFAAWNQRQDDTGTEVRGSIAYGQKDTTINRQVVGTSQAGTGSSTLISQGAQLTAKYGFGLGQSFVVSPYAGVRYSQNNMGGYTEGASAGVTAPLTFGAVNTNATTLLAGVGGSYKGIPKTNLFASAGIESDTNTAAGTVNGTSSTITGLTPVNFNANPVKNRPTATVGATYDIEKNQRLGVTGIYRQEAYQAVSTTTVMATYTVGF